MDLDLLDTLTKPLQQIGRVQPEKTSTELELLDTIAKPLRQIGRVRSIKVRPENSALPVAAKLHRSKSTPRTLRITLPQQEIPPRTSTTSPVSKTPARVHSFRNSQSPRTPTRISGRVSKRNRVNADPPSVFDLPANKVSDFPIEEERKTAVFSPQYLEDFELFFDEYGDCIEEQDFEDMIEIINERQSRPRSRKGRKRPERLASVPEESEPQQHRIASLTRMFSFRGLRHYRRNHSDNSLRRQRADVQHLTVSTVHQESEDRRGPRSRFHIGRKKSPQTPVLNDAKIFEEPGSSRREKDQHRGSFY